MVVSNEPKKESFLKGSVMMKLFRRYLPRSLFDRFLLIIILPNIIIQLFSVYIFYERHWNNISRDIALSIAGDIIMVVQSSWNTTDEEKEKIFKIASNAFSLQIKYNKNRQLHEFEEDIPADFKAIHEELSVKLPLANSIYNLRSKDIAIDIQFSDGVLNIVIPKKRISNPSSYIFILWMLGVAMVFIVISIFFMQKQVRSILRLSEAADSFGRGNKITSFRPEGATEVRKVGRAFIEMRNRIDRQIEQRMEMLAGVSHDLKTPLTRMKLQLAMMKPSKQIKELEHDITELEKMVKEYLDFTKGRDKAPAGPINVTDLLRSIIAGYRRQHKNIELKTKQGIVISLNANSFRRAINNLLDNALRYGKSVMVDASVIGKYMVITIDDDGPGIPPKKREAVFKPFYRIDKSRNLDNGGTGLGLSIAKDAIVGFGGKISLDDSPMKGLRVIIRIPM